MNNITEVYERLEDIEKILKTLDEHSYSELKTDARMFMKNNPTKNTYSQNSTGH